MPDYRGVQATVDVATGAHALYGLFHHVSHLPGTLTSCCAVCLEIQALRKPAYALFHHLASYGWQAEKTGFIKTCQAIIKVTIKVS